MQQNNTSPTTTNSLDWCEKDDDQTFFIRTSPRLSCVCWQEAPMVSSDGIRWETRPSRNCLRLVGSYKILFKKCRYKIRDSVNWNLLWQAWRVAGHENNDQTQAKPDWPWGSEGSNKPDGPEWLDGPDEPDGPGEQDKSRSDWPRQNIPGYGELSSDGPSSSQPRCEKRDYLHFSLN